MINGNLKIGIDALSFENTEGSSIVVYLSNLVRLMAKLRPKYTFSVFMAEDAVDLFSEKTENVIIIPLVKKANPLLRRLYKEQFILPLKAFQYKLDVIFGAFHTIPLICSLLCRACIVTMYDLRFVDVIGDFSPLARLYRDTFYGLSAKYASSIITISEFTKKRVVEHWGIDDRKVHAVYLASSHEGREKPDNSTITSICHKYGINSEFILTTANARNKNTEATLSAFSMLPTILRNRYKLVATGTPQSYKNELNLKAGELGIENELILLNHIPHEDVWILHNGASAFVFLSRYEGFGLPVLDSMIAGVPIICSNLCSLPELVENNYNGILVDPNDSEYVAKSLEKILIDESLRDRLIKSAHIKALQFSWENTAIKTLSVIETLYFK